jgi:hypothetical protein
VRLWDARTGAATCALSGHTDSVEALRWGGEGLLFSASRDRTVLVYAVAPGGASAKLVRTLAGHGHRVNALALNTDALCRTGAFDHRGALALSTGETAGEVIKAGAEANPVKKLAGPLDDLVGSAVLEGQGWHKDVLQHRAVGKKVVGLEDEADLAVPEPGQFGRIQAGQVRSLEKDLAGIGTVERSDQVQHRALARAAGTNDGRAGTGRQGQRRVPQDRDRGVAHGKRLGDASELQQGFRHSVRRIASGTRLSGCESIGLRRRPV